jgi:hypothetical protein
MSENYLDLINKLQIKINETNENHQDILRLIHELTNELNRELDANNKLHVLVKNINPISDPIDEIVKFNVGGKVFATFKSTIKKRIRNLNYDVSDENNEYYGPNLLECLITGLVQVKTDENNAFFIDRNNQYFDYILDYLRMTETDHNEFKLPFDRQLVKNIEREAEYYKVLHFIYYKTKF